MPLMARTGSTSWTRRVFLKLMLLAKLCREAKGSFYATPMGGSRRFLSDPAFL
jgi:hypothetical protein